MRKQQQPADQAAWLGALNAIGHNQPMNKRQSKAEIRQELEQQVADYMREGGEIKQIRSGISGLEHGTLLRPPFSDGKPVQSRTPALDVLAAIDARRLEQRNTRKAGDKPARTRRKPQKKMLYDDFGEPLREVWVDD